MEFFVGKATSDTPSGRLEDSNSGKINLGLTNDLANGLVCCTCGERDGLDSDRGIELIFQEPFNAQLFEFGAAFREFLLSVQAGYLRSGHCERGISP